MLPRGDGKAEVADLCGLGVGEKNVGRFDVAVNEAFLVRGLQTFCDLDGGAQDLRLGDTRVLRHEIVEAAVIDQFHDEIDLIVRVTGGINLHDVRMIDRGGEAGFLFEARGFGGIGTEFFAQKFERNEAIEPGVARFVDGAHPADTKSFDELKVIERSLDAKFLAALRAGDSGEWFDGAGVDDGAAGGAGLGRRVLGHLAYGSTRNFKAKGQRVRAGGISP